MLEQGIDTTTPAGRLLFHVIVAMDEMTADLISEGTLEGLNPAPTSALEPIEVTVGVPLTQKFGCCVRRVGVSAQSRP
ncbi:recombinase family protein [Nocardia niwae]|uniref:Recombinase family protein n=1 Tax=Nocardia niwae TaxID=626084 RepID=A0ABV2XCK4_9NOCA